MAIPLCCAATAACGGTPTSTSTTRTTSRGAPSVAQQVCAAAGRGARSLLGAPVSARIVDPDPANTECRLAAGRLRIEVVAQASAQAWAEFDTTQVHQVQAYGSGAVHDRRQIPRNVAAPGMLAAWIAARHELFATNGTQSRGGSYVTVTVNGGRASDRARVRLARAVTLAALAVAPRGPNPVPPS